MTAENHQAPDRNLAMELVRVTDCLLYTSDAADE